MKTPQLLRVICTCCNKGDLVTEDLEQNEIRARHRELCLAAKFTEVPSMTEEGFTVFVCSETCRTVYETEVGPFRLQQKKLSSSDMADRPALGPLPHPLDGGGPLPPKPKKMPLSTTPPKTLLVSFFLALLFVIFIAGIAEHWSRWETLVAGALVIACAFYVLRRKP